MKAKIPEFNKQFSDVIYEEGLLRLESDSKKDQINAIILLEISIFFGKRSARSILDENDNLLDRETRQISKTEKKFNLFIKNRLGIGKEVNIRESNALLKKSIDMGEPIGVMHAAIVELIRMNLDNYRSIMNSIGKTNSSILLVDFVETGVVNKGLVLKAIDEYIL